MEKGSQEQIIKRFSIVSNSIAKGQAQIFSTFSPTKEKLPIHKENGVYTYVCGNCYNELFSNLGAPIRRFGNVIVCPNCMTGNEGFNIVDSLLPVSLLKNLPTYVENNIVLDYGNIDGNRNDEIRQLRERLTLEWSGEHRKMPGVIYQYTSSFGVIGMISSHSIWMTDVAYMNDTSETKLGMDLIKNYVQEKKDSISDECYEFIMRSSSFTHTDPLSSAAGRFIACFCTNNDLLSQWRAYAGNGNGYNIGFDSKRLSEAKGVIVRKVVYDKEKQQKYVKETIDSYCELFERLKPQLSDGLQYARLTFSLSSFLDEFVSTFKHEAFSEEDEWRLIYPYNLIDHLDRIKFRTYNGVPMPYIELGLSDFKDDIPHLPIVEITHGPVLQTELTKKSLSILLLQNGYSHVELNGSLTPFRV